MLKSKAEQRRREIIGMLNHAGDLSVECLAQSFHASEVTIRKDLAALEAEGLLLRRYGGAILLPKEKLAELRSGKVSQRKRALARSAAALIAHKQRIIIDSGHTTAHLAQALADKRDLVIMTNSLSIASALCEQENGSTLLMTGGTWDPQSEALQGQLAETVLKAYDFDLLFIGADGLDLARGTTTFNELYSLSRTMADVSARVVVMAEADKIGRKIPNLELPWSCVDVLVTDARLQQIQKEQIEQHDVEVICTRE